MVRASMEPSSAEDGNDVGLVTGETHAMASMEPSSAEDGNSAVDSCGVGAADASMEPSSAEDGNLTSDSGGFSSGVWLQWSRPQLRTETCVRQD